MKNPSRSFYFVAILCLLLALGGIFMAGYYSGRNDSLAKLGRGLGFGGAVLLIIASAVHKKQKGNPDSPRSEDTYELRPGAVQMGLPASVY